MQLTLLETRLSIVRFPPASPVPKWVPARGFVSITHTDAELSIICDDARIPASERAERGWVAMRVTGPLEFSLTGILAALAVPLAAAKVPIFAISTYDTDYVLVKDANLAVAVAALREAGHTVEEAAPSRR